MNESTTQAAPTPTVRYIDMSQLVLAEENVRKTAADSGADAELEASIAAHGLLENLITRAEPRNGEDTERYAVIAGGRRLAALKRLADEGRIAPDQRIPCTVIDPDHHNTSEISLAENMARAAMHPVDQVKAFSKLADCGMTAATIAIRFGVSERTVEQRLRLGRLAPELLDAYRGEKVNMNTLEAFTVTTDKERQLSVWKQLFERNGFATSWQVRRLLTDERVPGSSRIARFVGVDAYEAAGGRIMRDLFADEYENGTWIEDTKLLNELAHAKLDAEAKALSQEWLWTEAVIDLDWNTMADMDAIPRLPGEPTDEEAAEIERHHARQETMNNLDETEWTDAVVEEANQIEARLDTIQKAVEARRSFRDEDKRRAGCIVTIGKDGSLKRIEGLFKRTQTEPEQTEPVQTEPAQTEPAQTEPAQTEPAQTEPAQRTAQTARIAVSPDESTCDTPPRSTHVPATNAQRPPTPATNVVTPAKNETQTSDHPAMSAPLIEDLTIVRSTLVKAHLARDFKAAFDLFVFHAARRILAPLLATGHQSALDIDLLKPPMRPMRHDEDFSPLNPGEALLEADKGKLPLDWIERDRKASFKAFQALSQTDKEMLFAAAVARTAKNQLSTDERVHPELEDTIARLDIDFAKHVRPTADLIWTRLTKDAIFKIARDVLGPEWVKAHAKDKKAELAKAMENAFAKNETTQSTALAWTLPGFEAADPS